VLAASVRPLAQVHTRTQCRPRDMIREQPWKCNNKVRLVRIIALGICILRT